MKPIFVVLLASIVAICLAGPLFYFRPPATISLDLPVASVHELDEYLAHSERMVAGLQPDLAKGVRWVNSSDHHRTKYAIVYLHGFTASRRDVSPLVEELATYLHANVYFSRLAAHGLKSGEAFASVTATDWFNDAVEALAIGRMIGRHVILVGTSTGGLLATLLALNQEAAPHIAALVLLSPNFGLRPWPLRFISGPLGKHFARLLVGKQRVTRPENAYHERYWTHAYDSRGLVPLMNLTNYLQGLNLDGLRTPTLVLYTRHDQILDLAELERSFVSIGTRDKSMVDLHEATRHELVGEALAPDVVAPALETIKGFLLSKARVRSE